MIDDEELDPGSDEDPFNIVKRAEKWSTQCKDHTEDWRKEARELYDLVAGKQWTEEEIAYMEDMTRPIVTFNRTGPFIDAITGLEVANRQEVNFYPREIGDVQKHEVLTAAADWVRDQNGAEFEESDAFVDLTICGMGWSESFMDYEEDPEGLIQDERRDPLEMQWDPSARARNLTDAKWIIHNKKYPKSEAKLRWPNIFDTSDQYILDQTVEIDLPGDDYGGNSIFGEAKLEKIVVKHVQWYEREKYYLVASPQGLREVNSKRWEMILQLTGGNPPYRATQMTRRVYYRAFIAGSQLLQPAERIRESGFTFHCMTGKRDRNTGLWYGICRGLKDPQRWVNKFFSSILQEISTNGKGLMAEQSAFISWSKAEEDYADPTKILQLNDGGLQKVMPKPKAEYPMGSERLMEFAAQAFNDVTGVSAELMGMTAINQPGVVEQYRKQSGMAILSWLFDSLRRYRKEKARITVEFIKNYIADGRLIKVVGQQKAQYVQLFRKDLNFRYDIEVEEAPTSINQKERTWTILQSLIPSFAQVGMVPPPDVLDYLPVPQKLIEAWKQVASNQTPQAQQIQQLQQMVQQLQQQMQAPERQLSLQRMQLENQGKRIENKHETIKAVKTESEAVLNQEKAQDISDDKVVKIANINKLAAETGALM